MTNIITIDGLSKRFASRAGPVEAVRGISFEVAEGEIFGLLGPNGAGKTTTLRMLTTLLPIDAGSAIVAGFDVARDPQMVRTHIGYVSQKGGADDLATGRENIVLQGRLYGADSVSARERAQQLLDVLDLAELGDRRVNTYSGGQRRRLDIALGLVHSPRVLFLDEPSTGLDPRNRASLWEEVRALRERGTTVFLTTHYLDEADVLCDRIVIVDHGQIVAKGAPSALKKEVLGESVVLRVPDDGAQRAELALGAEPYVRELKRDGGQLRLYVENGSACMPSILRLLDEEGITLTTISLARPTLDDVFLARTGRQLDGELAVEGRQAA